MEHKATADIPRVRRKVRRARLDGPQDRRLVQAEVDRELLNAVRQQAESANHTMVKIVTWGLEEYLLHTNKVVAEKLRIRTTGSR